MSSVEKRWKLISWCFAERQHIEFYWSLLCHKNLDICKHVSHCISSDKGSGWGMVPGEIHFTVRMHAEQVFRAILTQSLPAVFQLYEALNA
jgi:hypothetical protein